MLPRCQINVMWVRVLLEVPPKGRNLNHPDSLWSPCLLDHRNSVIENKSRESQGKHVFNMSCCLYSGISQVCMMNFLWKWWWTSSHQPLLTSGFAKNAHMLSVGIHCPARTWINVNDDWHFECCEDGCSSMSWRAFRKRKWWKVNPTTHRACDDEDDKTVRYWFCFNFGRNLGHASVRITFEPVGSLQLQWRIPSSFMSSISYMENSVGDMSLLVTDFDWHPFDSLSTVCHIVPGEETLAHTSDGSLVSTSEETNRRL